MSSCPGPSSLATTVPLPIFDGTGTNEADSDVGARFVELSRTNRGGADE